MVDKIEVYTNLAGNLFLPKNQKRKFLDFITQKNSVNNKSTESLSKVAKKLFSMDMDRANSSLKLNQLARKKTKLY